MSKNRIIPQMFDVRPVNETGDLDWKRISSIGSNKKNEFEKEKEIEEIEQAKSTANAYFLGVGVRSDEAPVFHSPKFNLKDLTAKASKEKTDQLQNLLREEMARKKQLLLEKEEQSRRQRAEAEKVLLLKKKQAEIERQFQIQAEARRIQEENKRIIEQEAKQRKYQEALVLAERQQRQFEEAQWLKAESLREKKQQAHLRKIARKQKIAWILSFLKLKRKRKFHPFREATFDSQAFFHPSSFGFQFDWQKFVPAFATFALVLAVGIGSASFISKGFGMKGRVLGVSQDGYANLATAVEEIKAQNFEGSAEQFTKATENFSQASDDLEEMGGGLLDATRFVPFASKVSSGKNAVEAGKHFSTAGQSLNEIIKTFAQLKQTTSQSSQSDISLLEIFQNTEKNVTSARRELDEAQKNIDLIAIDDLPADKQQKFLLLKEKLPELRKMMEVFSNNSHIFIDLLGGNGPRKYLFLFQNNSEMRATGGFIGSYGLLDISNGHIKNFFIDGIFNPDGQLKDRIVPPAPIQKISANWSLHDSNWFPDFPASAQKAVQFYEKTGGPTTDGVISLTPTLMQKLLKITGPIEMPDYDVTLDADNFIELTQYEVEVDYDKEENKPKKILSDLAPMLLEKLLNTKNLADISSTMNALIEGLNEKHILLYSQDKELEDIISDQGWSGEVLPADKDYLSVINTNINGFKTDASIEESIQHKAEIQADGSIIDTVKIIRKHSGGDSQYEWLNKVNSDYMRVYVPKGSTLLEANGQTREINNPPLDYDLLGFKRDEDVQREESGISIDENSGTRIYQENEKTVFANWVYVSPGESVTISYKYLIPLRLFQLNVKNNAQQVDSYSLVAQKQSGSIGSAFFSNISYPESYLVKWNFPQNMTEENNGLKIETDLTIDRYEGVVFENIK